MATLQGKGAITTLATGDHFTVHDASSTAEDAAGDLKKITYANLVTDLESVIDALANLTSIQNHTVTLTGNLIRSGAHSLTFTTTAATSVTLPTSGTLLANVVEDTTPQLGGQLDMAGFALGDGTLELLTFVETGSAVNHIQITNAATGTAPAIAAEGDDTPDIDLQLSAKGAGKIKLGNLPFNADQTVGAGQDNYVLTYDNATGEIGLESAAAGGNVSNTGTPLNNQFAVWTNATTVEGITALTYDATDFEISADFIPNADGTIDLGSATNRYAVVHTDQIDLNGTTIDGTTLADPGADSFMMWDDSAVAGSEVVWGSLGDGLTTSGTDLSVNHALNAQTGTTYTLVLADNQKHVTMSNAAANTLTIPTNASVAFPTGTTLTVWMLGAGTTTIAGATGVTLSGNGGSVSAGSCDIQTRYGAATLVKNGTDTWLVSGDIDTVA